MKKRNTTLWVLALLGCLASFEAFSQATVNHPFAGNAGTFTILAGGNTFYNYYDNGGVGGAYSPNQGYLTNQLTFAPSDALNKRVRATFTSFNTEANFDGLYIFNNNITTNPVPGGGGAPFQGGPAGIFYSSPGVIIANTGLAAVGANPSESLTFAFVADGSVQGTGFAAVVDEVNKINCVLISPANVTVSASASACPGIVNITAPTFNPAGCQTPLTFQYSVNGGAFVTVAYSAQVAVNGLVLGANVIAWRILDPASGLVVSSGSNTVFVADNIAPTITCPQNIIVNLSPGECCRFVSWPNPVATDNCPLVAAGPTQLLQQNVQFTNYWTGFYINMTNINAGQAMNITNLNVQASLAGAGAGIYNLRAFMKLGTHVGFENNAAAWTPVGNVNVNITAGFPTQLLFDIPLTTPFQIPAGQVAGLYVVANNGTLIRLVAQLGLPTTQDANLRIQNPGVWANAGAAFTGTQFQGEAIAPQLRVSYNLQVNKQPVQIAGPVSGTELCKENSPYTVAYRIEDAATPANTATCSFTITINPFQNAIQSLICNDLVQVSLDPTCTATIGADQVLEGGPYKCYDDYVVELDKSAPFGNGPWLPAVLGPGDVGKTYQVRVTDPATGNKCWGNLLVEDKLPPVLDCKEHFVYCNASSFEPCVDPGPSFLAQPPAQLPASFAAHGGGTAYTLSGNTLPGGVYFNLTNNSTQDLIVNGFGVRLGNPAFGQVNPPQTFQIYTAPTYVGNETNPAAWTNVGPAVVTTIPPYFATGQGPLAQAPMTANVTIAAGQTRGFHIFGATACPVFNYFNTTGPQTNGPWTMQGGPVSFALLGNLFQAGAQSAPNIAVNYSIIAPPSCLPNGLQLNVDAFANGDGTFRALAGAGNPVLDYCSDVNLSYSDTSVDEDCTNSNTKTITRKWTARDASGNTSTCNQRVSVLRPKAFDLELPPSYDGVDEAAIACGGVYPTPDWIQGQGLQGYPLVFGKPSGCDFGWNYSDVRIDVCDGTYKIRRRWSILNWCTGSNQDHDQIIKITDDVAPTFTCPANITVGTDPFTCCATVDLPDFIVTDNCSRIKKVSAMVIGFDPQTNQQIGMFNVSGFASDFPGNNYWDRDTLAVMGSTPCLPQGTHTVIYQVEDDCGNTRTCSFRLTVRDLTPPVAACDEFTVVSIGVDDPFDCYGPAGFQDVPPALDACSFAGVTWVKATTFDDGSYDNCGSVKFTIQRMAPYSDCINALNAIRGTPGCASLFPSFPSEFERAISEGDSVKFYCCEVGTTQMVVLRIYQLDVNGNLVIGQDGTPVRNECMVEVSVQDKIKPICTSPANVSVSCESFDPSLWAYGKPTVVDNCCLDTGVEYQGQCGLTHTTNISLFDTVCNRGTITRTFRAFDCHGNSSSCTQRVFVTYEQDYFLRFPNDVIVTVCDGTGNYGEPTFFGEDCELLGVSHVDEVFTVVPDACYKIERTWTVINWCTYNPNAGCINVPNPNPNAITNHPSNLPGPTLSAPGTPAPWAPTVVAIAPGQTPTNYGVTYWNANANCYKYKQIIKVIDTQKPIIDNCPASPVEVCDLTPNDAQLWNEMYWWDNTIQSHDLCEAPTDLSITATDLCSGSNINIRYLLFLDLDGDGTMESVINSTQTGIAGLLWNNVPFNNANGGGSIRQFDGRPVPSNQKYGFAIQTTVSGDNKTASVRWNTQQSQNTFVVPELPYGTHKIKWFVEDGCGNEQTCEYTFVVKDCKKPTVVCINGLSVNIMPTKMVSLWDTDFLQYTEDNCTPANRLVTAIRKAGQGTGFPRNPDNTPQKNVTFTCTELGKQNVELWSIDLAGNADYCLTFVDVQDNMNNCSNNSATVAGALTTETGAGLEDASVALEGSTPPVSMAVVTDAAGQFNLASVPTPGNYTVTPMKDNDPLNGVSTFDLVLINKHILGLEPLSTPFKMIAADANNSRSITTFDIVELRKLILGIYTELPNNTSWRFVDKAFNFPNQSNPFQTIFPETKQIANLTADQLSTNFSSVKVGDVNGNAVTSSLVSTDDRTAGTLLFDVQDRTVKAGETFTVAFKAVEKVQGYQFTMNHAGLELVDVTPGANMSMANFGVFAAEQAVTTSWDGDVQGAFSLTFRATAAGELSRMLGVSGRITKAEAYSAGAERLQVGFRFNGANGSTITGLGFELYQNQPNPFVSKTQIGFYLPEAATATLTIFDEAGRLIFTQRGDFGKGYNAVTIDRSVLNTTGVLYYKLETAKESATRKMIQTK